MVNIKFWAMRSGCLLFTLIVFEMVYANSACNERAPREDLTPGVLLTCNACSLDLAAITRDLSVVIDDLLMIESIVEDIDANVSAVETVVENIDTNVSTIESVVDVINATTSAIESIVENLSPPCVLTPLTQADMPATLSIAGMHYCLAEDVTGNITINANDITFNLNGYTVNGIVTITSNGNRAILADGKIIAPAPTTNAVAGGGALIIGSFNGPAVTYCQIINCFISAQPTTTIGVDGALAVYNLGSDTHLCNCIIRGGDAAQASGNSPGGAGVQCGLTTITYGDGLILDSCQIFGGTGSGATLATDPTGNGGIGCIIFISQNFQIVNSSIYGGSSGPISTFGVDAVTLGNGGAAVSISSTQGSPTGFITQSKLFGGNVQSIGGISSIATTGNVTNGTGGDGLISSAGQLEVSSSDIFGGDVGNVIVETIGSGASFAPGVGGAGIRLTVSSIETYVSNCSLSGGAGPEIVVGSAVNNVAGGSGGTGLEVNQQPGNETNAPLRLVVKECDITGGGSLAAIKCPTIANLGPVVGNNSGIAISFPTDNTAYIDILNTTISTPNGGSVVPLTAAGPSAITGGNGGVGINVSGLDIQAIRIADCAIVSTGNGGDGASGFTVGTGGNGGTGIVIGAGVTSIEVSNSTITYTGKGGVGGVTAGAGGQALVNASPGAVMYSNFAHTISGSPIFDLGPGAYIESPTTSGTAFASAANPYGNVHQP